MCLLPEDQRKCDLMSLSLVDFFRKHGKDISKLSNESVSEVQKQLNAITAQAMESAKENAKLKDRHMVWLAGGALVLVANIILFVSGSESVLPKMELLLWSLWSFGICIISVISSYQAQDESLIRLPKAKKYSDGISELVTKSQKAGDEFWTKAEQAKAKWCKLVRWGDFFDRLTGMLNRIAFIFFFIGLSLLLLFASNTMNQLNNDGDDPNGGKSSQQSPPPQEQKAAQVSGLMFDSLVGSTIDTLAESSEGENPNE